MAVRKQVLAWNKSCNCNATRKYVEGKNTILFAKHFWKAYFLPFSKVTLYAAFEYINKNNGRNKNNGGPNSGKIIKITPE